MISGCRDRLSAGPSVQLGEDSVQLGEDLHFEDLHLSNANRPLARSWGFQLSWYKYY